MNTKNVPAPAPMAVDRATWKGELSLSNFINAFYEFRDLTELTNVARVLLVGTGQGLEEVVLRWRGFELTTFDIDPSFGAEHIGSVHDLSRFPDCSFDAVVASHVLEHLALPYLDTALGELARVAKYSLIYLPVTGRHAQLRFAPGVRGIDMSLVVDVFNWLDRPDGLTSRYMQGQHFWEVGRRGFRVKDLQKRFSRHFDIIKSYRNRDWLPSHNFVLRSKLAG